MQTITTIGLDIAKSVFQVHGVDAEGKVIIRRQLKRRYVLAFFQKLPPCLVGIKSPKSAEHFFHNHAQAGSGRNLDRSTDVAPITATMLAKS
jgi:transposase